MTHPLYSERQGRQRQLSKVEVTKLTFAVLERFSNAGYFDWALGPVDLLGNRRGGALQDPEDCFDRRLNSTRPWRFVESPHRISSPDWDDDLLYDTLELIHSDVVARPPDDPDETSANADVSRGKEELRAALNEVLALREPKAEMLDNGEIVEHGPNEFHPLVSDPVPSLSSDDVVRIAVDDAVNLFRRRGADDRDRLAAVQRLAGVLERLREEVDRSLLRKDESALFDIANNFAIRHDNAKQRTDYDRALYLEWIFYSYLATIRLLVRVRNRRSS